jgi:hypothetical protein
MKNPNQCFGSGVNPDSIGTENPDPNTGMQKLSPPKKLEKMKKLHVSKARTSFSGYKKTYMTFFNQKIFKLKMRKKFVIKNRGLEPDPDWILIQQQPGSETGFSKIPGSRIQIPGIRIRNTAQNC